MSGSTATAKPAATSTTPCGGSSCLPVCTLEIAMQNIVKVFHHFAPREHKDDCLSLKDLKELLECQAPNFLSVCNRGRPKYIEDLFKKADVDNDKKLTFEEAVKIFGYLADDAHRISHGEDRCGPDKD